MCIEWPISWASVNTASSVSLKLSSMYGCVPYTGAEYAPLRLPVFSKTSIHRSRNAARTWDWYSAPSGATDSMISSPTSS